MVIRRACVIMGKFSYTVVPISVWRLSPHTSVKAFKNGSRDNLIFVGNGQPSESAYIHVLFAKSTLRQLHWLPWLSTVATWAVQFFSCMAFSIITQNSIPLLFHSFDFCLRLSWVECWISLREITWHVVLELLISFINTFMISKFNQFLEVNRLKSDTINIEFCLSKHLLSTPCIKIVLNAVSLLRGMSLTCSDFG